MYGSFNYARENIPTYLITIHLQLCIVIAKQWSGEPHKNFSPLVQNFIITIPAFEWNGIFRATSFKVIRKCCRIDRCCVWWPTLSVNSRNANYSPRQHPKGHTATLSQTSASDLAQLPAASIWWSIYENQRFRGTNDKLFCGQGYTFEGEVLWHA